MSYKEELKKIVYAAYMDGFMKTDSFNVHRYVDSILAIVVPNDAPAVKELLTNKEGGVRELAKEDFTGFKPASEVCTSLDTIGNGIINDLN